MKLNALSILLFALLLVCGCSQPPVRDYTYKNLNRLKGWRENIPITLEFDMTDTISPCELYIVGEIAIKRSIGKSIGYPVNITLIAPDSTQYSDSATLPLHVVRDGETSRKSHGVMEIEWPYRKNIYNRKPGQWTMVISQSDAATDYSNIIGLGVHCKQNRL